MKRKAGNNQSVTMNQKRQEVNRNRTRPLDLSHHTLSLVALHPTSTQTHPRSSVINRQIEIEIAGKGEIFLRYGCSLEIFSSANGLRQKE